jgi:hypothetical protein
LALWQHMGGPVAAPNTSPGQTVQHWSLWRYVLLLALVAALVESVLANEYLLKGRQPG